MQHCVLLDFFLVWNGLEKGAYNFTNKNKQNRLLFLGMNIKLPKPQIVKASVTLLRSGSEWPFDHV